jgi:phosphate uptake regulator
VSEHRPEFEYERLGAHAVNIARRVVYLIRAAPPAP